MSNLSKMLKKRSNTSTKSKLAKKNEPEWEWQPIRNGKGHYWFLKPKYNRSERR